MPKKAKSTKAKASPKQPTSPVQPLETDKNTTPPAQTAPPAPTQPPTPPEPETPEAPTPPADNSANEELQKQLDEANAKAKAAEERAAKAEEKAANSQVPEEPSVPVSQQKPEQYDKEGNALCWNCLNNGKKVVLEGGNKCPDCGFEKNKLYNGGIEAEKAGQRAQAAQDN